MTLVQTVGTLANVIVVVSVCISGIITIPPFFFKWSVLQFTPPSYREASASAQRRHVTSAQSHDRLRGPGRVDSHETKEVFHLQCAHRTWAAVMVSHRLIMMLAEAHLMYREEAFFFF